MRTLTRETYYCDHCNKMYLTKGHCKIHEKKCSKNPENYRDCFTCKGLISDYIGYTETDKHGNIIDQRSVKVFYCSFIDMYVTPPKAEHKNNMYVLDKQNVFMPKKCEAKEEKTSEDYFNEIFNKKNRPDFQ